MSLIKCEKLYYVYKGRVDSVALTDISLTIDKGKFVSIMGPNGSGKSTLLSCIGGMKIPSSGRIIVDDLIIDKLGEDHLAKYKNRKIGYIFQDLNLIELLTVRENLELPSLIGNFDKSEMNERVKICSEKLDISSFLDIKVSELSGGEQQKVAIAMALINDPDIILADEPTSNLDKKGRDNVISIFRNLTKKGKTVLVVSHDPAIQSSVDEVIYLDKGYLK